MKRNHEKSSGNVFADLGLPNSEQELIKAELDSWYPANYSTKHPVNGPREVNEMKCTFCGGKMVRREVTFIHEEGDAFLIVERRKASGLA